MTDIDDGQEVQVTVEQGVAEVLSDPILELRRARAEMLTGVREERQFHASAMEIRESSDGTLRFTGYASVTEHPYEVGDFVETIARGAFRRTLSEDPDVVLAISHGEGGRLPIARTKSGTMTLTEDARGLRVDADLNPNDPDVKALVPKLQRGDVDAMSFAFRVTDQHWSEDRTQRLVRSCAIHKGDVSIVAVGANDLAAGSLVTMRSADGTVELRAGKTISTANQSALQGVLDRIARADEELDAAQPELAAILGVPNPDDEDEGTSDESDPADMMGGERAAETPETAAPAWELPDYATRDRERLALLQNDGRRHR